MKTTYWLDWEKKTIKPNKEGLKEIPWAKISQYPLTIYCDQNTWPLINLYQDKEEIITNQEQRTHQIGKATIKELRGATEEIREGLGTQALKKCWELCPNFVEEHPSHNAELFEDIGGWVFAPRFENLQQGTFENVYKIDIKSCYANIMRDYPLPCGSPELITDPVAIEQKLKESKEGFVNFFLTRMAIIKNNQIPFIPNSENQIKSPIGGRFLLHARLFNTFIRQYKTLGKIQYKKFWIFKEKKGSINSFLDYCEELKKTDENQGKMLANAFYGAVGKSKFGGYNYRAWTLAVNHLAILQTYYLYRQFKTEQILAIRSDCIYVTGELPTTILKEANKYHITKYNKVIFQGEENIFIVDTGELKARLVQGEERVKILTKLFEKDN